MNVRTAPPLDCAINVTTADAAAIANSGTFSMISFCTLIPDEVEGPRVVSFKVFPRDGKPGLAAFCGCVAASTEFILSEAEGLDMTKVQLLSLFFVQV